MVSWELVLQIQNIIFTYPEYLLLLASFILVAVISFADETTIGVTLMFFGDVENTSGSVIVDVSEAFKW